MEGTGRLWRLLLCVAVVYIRQVDPQTPDPRIPEPGQAGEGRPGEGQAGRTLTTTEYIPHTQETTSESPLDSETDYAFPDWLDEVYYEAATIEPLEEEVFDLRIIPPVKDGDDQKPPFDPFAGYDRERDEEEDPPGRRRGRVEDEDYRDRGSRRRNEEERDRERGRDRGRDRHRNRRPSGGRNREESRRRRPGVDGNSRMVPPGVPSEMDDDYRDGLIGPDDRPFGERREWVEENDYYGGYDEWIGRPPEGVEGEREGELDDSRQRNIGKKLVVTTRLEAPFLNLKQEVQFVAGNDRFEGYLADILQKLAESIGFDYEIRLVRDGRLGAMNSFGVWDGMIGEIERGESDIAAGSLSVTPLREQVVEFTESFLTLRSSALIHKPNRRGNNGQGRIKELQQLLGSNLTYGVIQGGESEYFLRHTSSPEFRGMYSRMVNFWPSAFVNSLEAGIDRVRTQDYAFIIDTPMAEYIANKKPCEFYAIEPFLDLREYAFAMRKGDGLRQVIDAELKKLKLEGEMQNMYLKWWRGECSTKKYYSTPSPSTTNSPLLHAPAAQGGSIKLLQNMTFSFFLFVLGLLLSKITSTNNINLLFYLT